MQQRLGRVFPQTEPALPGPPLRQTAGLYFVCLPTGRSSIISLPRFLAGLSSLPGCL